MKTNDLLVIVALGGLLLLSTSPQRDNTPVVKGTQATAKKAKDEYVSAASKAFLEVGQDILDGKITTMAKAHEELADRNDKALDKYGKVNELLNDVDPDDMQALGKLCIEIGKGLAK